MMRGVIGSFIRLEKLGGVVLERTWASLSALVDASKLSDSVFCTGTPPAGTHVISK